MEAEYQLTAEEAEKEMEQLRKVFTIVRLVDANGIQCLASGKPSSKNECSCYCFWGKNKPCENCISAIAFRDKAEKTKLEFLDSVLYQVFSKYVEIDGVPYVMEMLKKLDLETLIDKNESDKLVNQIFGLDDRIYRDVLTGAYNRRYYEENLKTSVNIQGVAMIDLDDFKIYNDTFGHSAGDAALKTVVKQIRSCVRSTDSIVRYGGDEFLLLIPGIDEDTFVKKLREIRERVFAADVPGYSTIHLSVSVGGLFCSNEMLEKVVEKADRLMYQAKNQKNTVVMEKGIVDANGNTDKEKNNRMMITVLSHIVEFRNGESGMHVLHINRLTEKILESLVQKTDRYHLSYSDRYLITTASALHDIGKIGIDDKILNKPGKLTKDEFEIIKTHTLIGARMLEEMEVYKDEPLIKMAYQICRWHHERYDGKGYPDGLKGDEIPISAQVVSLADVYDALVSERVYKKAFSHEKVMEMILAGECGTFNPLLLECLTDIQDTLQDELSGGGYNAIF